MDSNPFTVLTFIAAPAILTNASSVLALGTSNRFARAVDRARELARVLEKEELDRELGGLWGDQIVRAELRAQFLIRALKAFYTALASFAAASFFSLLGTVFSAIQSVAMVNLTMALAFAVGALGFWSLIYGCWLLIHETRLALEDLQTEGKTIRDRKSRRGESAVDTI